MSQWTKVFPLPAASANLAAVFYKRWLYAIGGATELSSPSSFQSVLRANIESADGTIGQWVPAAAPNTSVALPDNKFGPAVEFVSPRTIVVAGGAPVASGSLAPTGTQIGGGYEVMTSQIDSDGNLSPWVVQSSLPISVVSAALLACQGWLFLVGGNQLQVSLPYDLLQAQVSLPYDLGIVGGPFVTGETVTGGTSAATLVLNAGASASSGVLTGYKTGTFVDDETLTGGTSGAVTTANISGPLVSATFLSGETVTGGTSGATLVLNAAKSAASGTMTGFTLTGGPFSEDEVLTGGTSGAIASVTGAQGGSISTVVNTTVYKARLGADRSVYGPWQAVGQLPASVIGLSANNACVWRNEFLYLYDQATLWKVRVNRDGDFMSVNLPASFGGNGWVPFGGAPTANATLQQHQMCIINQNELLLAGGQDGSNASKVGVFSIHLDGDGNPTGPWHETTSLLTAIDQGAIVVAGSGDVDDLSAGSQVFIIGGSSSTTVKSEVEAARFGPSGYIGGI